MSQRPQEATSPWPHRLTVLLALVTFPLIWVGGLVTTYDAGMAVPDWPGTYGYNLFRYPWETWLAGPWDLFIEHGHRLLGAAAGLVAIALVVVAWLTDGRRWLVRAALGALALVIFQGLLGGARVLFDERLLALVHGCVGPLFFAYLAVLAIATSESWRTSPVQDGDTSGRFARLAWIIVGLAYFQLVLGAVLRHIPLAASPMAFRAALFMHLLIAAALLVQTGILLTSLLRSASPGPRRWPLAALLCLLVIGQIVLGGSTYVVKYAFPTWLHSFQYAAAYVVQEKSLAQALVTTAHVAFGSLILFVATLQGTLVTRPFAVSSSRKSENASAWANVALSRSAAA
jgi:cytochrome c oxidase assembly protein subunit 15